MTKAPPVPPENRSPKGTGDDKSSTREHSVPRSREVNTSDQGQQGNIKQNTTNQGYHQDR